MGHASPLAPYSPVDRSGLSHGVEETAEWAAFAPADCHRRSAKWPVATVTPSGQQGAAWGIPSTRAAGRRSHSGGPLPLPRPLLPATPMRPPRPPVENLAVRARFDVVVLPGFVIGLCPLPRV